MKKRILSVLLVFLMLLPSLASCSETTSQATETEDTAEAAAGTETVVQADAVEEEAAEETEEEVYVADDLADADFNGASYIVAGPSNRTTTAVTSSELNGEVINDAQFNAARTVEDRFNVVISYEDIANSDSAMSTAVKGLVNSGDATYSVTFGCDAEQINCSVGGYYLNLNAVTQFNYSQPWWTDATQTIAIGDKAYVASSYLSYYCLYYMRMFVMNKDMAEKLNIEIPYQKVYEGTWYLDDLTELAAIATEDTNGDGKMTSDDHYGLSYEVLYTLQNSMYVDIMSKDEGNYPVISFDVERAATYLEKMENLLDNYGYKESGYGATFFSNGKSLFCYCNMREVCNVIRDTEINYAFLPAPKLDESQEDYRTAATDVYWGIPSSCAANTDMIGTITEALSCQHFNYVRPAFFETTLQGKLAATEDDINMLELAADRLCIDFAFAYNSTIAGVSTLDDMATNSSVTSGNVASTFEKGQKAMNKSLEKLLTKYEELQ